MNVKSNPLSSSISHLCTTSTTLLDSSLSTVAGASYFRGDVILTNTTGSGGTDYYIKRGAACSATNWDFILAAGLPPIVIDNWEGVITCFPAPTAGDINIAEGRFAGPSGVIAK